MLETFWTTIAGLFVLAEGRPMLQAPRQEIQHGASIPIKVEKWWHGEHTDML